MSDVKKDQESGPSETWKKAISSDRKAEIEKEREEVKRRGALVRDPKGVYGVVCRACTKPNAVTATFCTGCGFPASEWDVQRLPDNIFQSLVDGDDIGATVRFRDKEIIVFDDRYAVSDNHVCVIPVQCIVDIKELTSEHVDLLNRLYQRGRNEFIRRKIGVISRLSKKTGRTYEEVLDECMVAGYNYPVSVQHLHIHMIVPPFRHLKVLQYPRWHPHAKVVTDLAAHGAVRRYDQHPNMTEGDRWYTSAIATHERLLALSLALSKDETVPSSNSSSSSIVATNVTAPAK